MPDTTANLNRLAANAKTKAQDKLEAAIKPHRDASLARINRAIDDFTKVGGELTPPEALKLAHDVKMARETLGRDTLSMMEAGVLNAVGDPDDIAEWLALPHDKQLLVDRERAEVTVIPVARCDTDPRTREEYARRAGKAAVMQIEIEAEHAAAQKARAEAYRKKELAEAKARKKEKAEREKLAKNAARRIAARKAREEKRDALFFAKRDKRLKLKAKKKRR